MKRILPFFIVLATLMSCSISEDELDFGNPQLEPSNQPALDYSFKGVWTVDDIKGIETYARTLIEVIMYLTRHSPSLPLWRNCCPR